MRKSWVAIWVWAVISCGDDAGHTRLDGGLDGGVSAGEAGARSLDGGALLGPDGAVIADAQVAPPSPSVCAPTEQHIPVTLPAYHREGTIDYPDPPPVGGDHNPCWGKWGVYDTSAPLAVEHWVHNLEHGGVVYLYHCPDGCADEVAEMTKFVKGRTQALLTPYDAMPTRFAVVAWGVRVTSDCFDKTIFEGFYDEHVNMGTEMITSDPPDSCL